MEGFFKKISSSFLNLLPVVRAQEEEEMVDPQIVLREECEKKKECAQLLEKLNTCNARVRSKKKTAETCDEEMIDFIECVDHCVAHTLFTKLK